MAKARLTTADLQEWQSPQDHVGGGSDELVARFSPGELTSRYRFREKGTESSPQLLELRYEAEAEVPPHFHDEDEIIYVVGGSMRINNRLVGPGATLFIPGETIYSFCAGPEGLHMLNFRPRIDETYHIPPDRVTI